MKKNLWIIIAIVLLIIPISVFAKEGEGAGKGFVSLNLKSTLKEENIEEEFPDYTEKDDQITIYMFRGKGCGYCRAFLTYLNSITKDYGDKFKIRTYAINFHGDMHPENTELIDAVSNYLGQPWEGVPYIIIGDQVFPGYIADWNENITKAIDSLYASDNRYDVFDAMREDGYVFNDDGTIVIPEEEKTTNVATIIWSLVFAIISTTITIIVIIVKNNKVLAKLDDVEQSLKGKNKGKVSNE